MADRKALVIVSGRTQQISDADTLLAGASVKSSAGNLVLDATGTDVQLAAGKNFSVVAGASAIDFSGGSGLFKTTTGAVTIGPGAVGVSGAASFTAAGTALAVTNDATVGGTLIVTGEIGANGGLGRSTAGTLLLGTDAQTTAISIGSVGVVTTILGDLTVNGTEIIIGPITFQGNVVFGDATTDTVQFVARVLDDLHFIKEVNHTVDIDASTTVSTAGGNFTFRSGAGSPASGATAGATGGTLLLAGGTGGAAAGGAGAAGAGGAETVRGGTGGAGTATGVAGVGGAMTLAGGAAGADGGAGGANGGALTLDGGAASGAGTGGAVSIGAISASSVGIGRAGITTTITGALSQLTGAVSLAGNAASSFTTSAGALTLTSAAAATWSTAAGALTLTSAAAATWSTGAGDLTLNGAAALLLQEGGSTVLSLDAGAATVQAGKELNTTGTGNIDLPNNASARFQIENVSVSANVTAANMGTLTAGSTSNADALHTHTTAGPVQATSGEAISAGAPVVFDDAAGTAKVFRADADGAAERQDCSGLLVAAAGGADVAVAVQMSGEASVADAIWDAVPGTGDVGKRVYLSTTVGQLTITAPTAAGSLALRVGWVSRGGAGAVKVAIGIGEGVLN